MPIEVLMPALSPTMEEGTLAKWLVKEGDTVSSGDIIAEIETDKATMEVEAVDEGVVGKIFVGEGAEGVKVNAVIAALLEEGEDKSALEGMSGGGGGAPPSVGFADTSPASGGGKEASAASGSPPPPAGEVGAKRSEGGSLNGRLRASPLAKRLAKTAGIDLSQISGSGPHGRIVKRDVEAAKAGGATPGATTAIAVSDAPAQGRAQVPAVRDPRAMGIPEGSYDLVPLDGMRKTIARRMTDSFRDVPHFPLSVDVELDALLDLRKKLNAKVADDGVKISVNDFLIRASALALKKVPDSNASYSPDGLLFHHHADVAVAVAIDGGLITPIIFRADEKGLRRISEEMKDLAARARDRKLKPEEYTGGTFSLSNLGMFGIKDFASILNEPHGMIMSVGAGEARPVVKDGALATATIMSVTVTCDHRVVDGAIGAKFTNAFKRYIEDPETMLL